jgi:hypothetical protein
MSTVEAALNSTATVTAEDICKHIWPNLRDKSLVLIGRLTAVVVIVLAMLWSPYCGRFANIFVVINKVPMMFAPAITTVFVLGVFWKRGTKQAALATFIAGLLVGLPYFLIDLPRDVPASQVQKAIAEHRVPPGRVVEQWYAGSSEDMQPVVKAGQVTSDRIFGTWESLPVAIKMEAREVAEVAKDQKVEGWIAVPLRYLQTLPDTSQLPSDKIIDVSAAVPNADLDSALQTQQLPADWTVVNYERIAQGIGIPFMMMGLILICMCIVVYIVVSLATPAPTVEELDKMGWRPPLKVIVEKKITGITDARIVALGLFILMAVLYVIFR